MPAAESSENDVVDQLRFAHAHGADCRIPMVHTVDALKRVGVDDGQVAGSETDDALEHPPPSRFEGARSTLAPHEDIAHREKRFGENRAQLALPGRQIPVAAGHRHAIRIPYDWSDENPNRKIEIPHHRLHCSYLLQVLLPENGDVRHHDVKQFGDDGQNPFKVMRSTRSFPILPGCTKTTGA